MFVSFNAVSIRNLVVRGKETGRTIHIKLAIELECLEGQTHEFI